MTFSDDLWQAIAPIREAIDALPLVIGLRDGSLDTERFGYYMTQDALYLADYGRALAACAAQSPTPTTSCSGRSRPGRPSSSSVSCTPHTWRTAWVTSVNSLRRARPTPGTC